MTNASMVADANPGDAASGHDSAELAFEVGELDCSHPHPTTFVQKARELVVKYMSFVGPGVLIAVAYIDPGNYSTDVAAGALFRFDMLFIVFLSNVFAIILQALSAKLGSVTGLNLAENCRAHFPRWLNISMYVLAEAAIIATDIAEVIGSAIALNLLLHVPLPAGVAITIIDVLIILLAYRPDGPLRGIRIFEAGVACLVFGVAICFSILLTKITGTSFAQVMRGYLPNSTIVSSGGLYASCGILGATVMPHSLYLGSGIVQPRLKAYDVSKGIASTNAFKYTPSLAAIRYTLSFTIAEVTVSLFTLALFINSAILIVAGATLSNEPNAASADLFSIHEMLSSKLAAAAGTVFALALLLSGLSSGVVATLAGQMVSEGFLSWTIRPWLRRIITRSIAIVPCLVVASSVGRSGLANVLNGSQVALSILLPFVTAPLIYFTALKKYMCVALEHEEDEQPVFVDLSNSWWLVIVSILVWVFITALNM